MTRKKQGTPQKLNNFENANSGNVLTDCKENLARHAVVDSDTSCNLVQNGVDLEFEKKNCNQNTMDTSCKKLVEFTTTFLLDSNLNSCANRKDFDETKDYIGDAVKLTWKNSAKQGIKRPPGSPTISPSPSKQQCDDQYNQNFDSTERDHAISAARNANKAQTPPRSGHSSPNINTSPNIDDPRFCDLASLTNAQKLLMDAMLRQKQLYDQCSNNWVNVQRNDNNCLSKSKAERYRWCVNGNDKQPTSTSHVTNLKRSATMAGIGTSPIQDKLYSTVFTGASKFHCRDCGDPFSTLVDLTVHMNKTGHFRDTNNPPSKLDEKSLEPRTKRRSLIEDESKADKVLTCMGCGNLFESLQDLSVHMIKTKHYEDVPSLRVWSQKNEVPELPTGIKKRNATPPTNAAEFSNYQKSLKEAALLSQSPFYFSLLGAMSANPAAAACANLLCSYPWLASNLTAPPFLPSMLESTLPTLYPPGFPTLLPPLMSTVNAMTTSADADQALTCTECNKKFQSLKSLTEHRIAASHFPTLNDFIFPTPFQAQTLTSNSQTKNSPSLSDTGKYSHRPNKSSRSSSNESAHRIPSPNSKLLNGSKPLPNVEAREETSNCDFIKSLESTIKSAISKVENPTSKSNNNDDGRRSFNLFTSMKDQEIINNHKSKNSFGHVHHEKSPVTTPLAATTERQSNDSPLDLTVKKSDNASPKQPFPMPHSPPRSTGNNRTISAYSGTLPTKDPLQSLKDNMNSLFSYLKPGQTAPATTKAEWKAKKSEHCYAPLRIESSSPTDVNPIQEMLKIVNRPELENSFLSVNDARSEGGKNRSSSSSTLSPVPPKKSCFSIFEDLVDPKCVDSKPNVNPLQKMQDLVDRKLMDHERRRTPPPSSYAITGVNRNSTNLPTVAIPPTLTEPARPRNGVHLQKPPKDAQYRSSEDSRCFSPTKEEKLKLYVSFSRLVTSLPHREMTSSMLTKADAQRISDECSLPVEYVQDWMAKSIGRLGVGKKLSFIRLKDAKEWTFEFFCTWCSQYTTSSVEDFSAHSESHLARTGSIISRGSRASVDDVTHSTPRVDDVTEPDHASPNLPHITSPCGGNSPDNATVEPNSEILRHRRCGDELASADDAISVTG